MLEANIELHVVVKLMESSYSMNSLLVHFLTQVEPYLWPPEALKMEWTLPKNEV